MSSVEMKVGQVWRRSCGCEMQVTREEHPKRGDIETRILSKSSTCILNHDVGDAWFLDAEEISDYTLVRDVEPEKAKPLAVGDEVEGFSGSTRLRARVIDLGRHGFIADDGDCVWFRRFDCEGESWRRISGAKPAAVEHAPSTDRDYQTVPSGLLSAAGLRLYSEAAEEAIQDKEIEYKAQLYGLQFAPSSRGITHGLLMPDKPKSAPSTTCACGAKDAPERVYGKLQMRIRKCDACYLAGEDSTALSAHREQCLRVVDRRRQYERMEAWREKARPLHSSHTNAIGLIGGWNRRAP